MINSNVIIIHGAYGYPNENWFGWLKQQLTALTVNCLVPQMPTPENHELSLWMQFFEDNYAESITENTILIGHSLGASFLLKFLEKSNKPVKAVILVGAFIGKVGIEKFDVINESFFQEPFQWEAIKKNDREFYCYHGSNDPYVARSNFDYIAESVNGRKILIANGGHLNAAAGFTTFPQLLIHLKKMIGIMK